MARRFRRSFLRFRSGKSTEGGISSKGFRVRFSGVTKLTYEKGERRITISVEPSLHDYDYLVNLTEIKHWDSPHSRERFSSQQIAEIRNSISAALNFMRLKFAEN